MHDSIAFLAWQPRNIRNPLHNAQVVTDEKGNSRTVIKGSWVVMTKQYGDNDDGTLQTRTLHPDWVDKNINADVLRTIQDTALSMYTKVDVNETTSNGDIVQSTAKGFLAVDGAKLNIKFDNREVQKVRYIPPNKKRGIEAHFEGLTGKDKYELTEQFMKENFDPAYIKQLVEMATSLTHKKPIFVPLPPGQSRGQGYKFDKRYNEHKTTVPIIFQQRNGEDSCLMSSFASALHYVGTTDSNKQVLKEMAHAIHDKRHELMNQTDTWKRFHKTLQEIHPYLAYRKIKRNKSQWNILQNEKDRIVCVLLNGEDGKKDHSITLVGDLLFDSNFEYAVKLCKQTLDLCCSTDIQNIAFVDYVCACDFPQLTNVSLLLKYKKYLKNKQNTDEIYS